MATLFETLLAALFGSRSLRNRLNRLKAKIYVGFDMVYAVPRAAAPILPRLGVVKTLSLSFDVNRTAIPVHIKTPIVIRFRNDLGRSQSRRVPPVLPEGYRLPERRRDHSALYWDAILRVRTETLYSPSSF